MDVGCNDAAAIATNLGYYKQRLGRGPTVVLKLATTLDGKIASEPGRRDDVTGERARRFAHSLRAARKDPADSTSRHPRWLLHWQFRQHLNRRPATPLMPQPMTGSTERH